MRIKSTRWSRSARRSAPAARQAQRPEAQRPEAQRPEGQGSSRRRAALALAGAAALAGAVLAAPGGPASAASPAARPAAGPAADAASSAVATAASGSQGNKYDWQDFHIYRFPSDPNDPNPVFRSVGRPVKSTDQLLTGPGTGCPPPDLPKPSPLSEGHGYRVPFLIKLSNGRMMISHSIASYHHGGQVPFQAMIYGITGWAKGYVDLPSMRMEVPADGVTLCNKAVAVRQIAANVATDWPPPADGKCTIQGITAHCGVFVFTQARPGLGFFQTQIEMHADPGTASAELTGVAPDGALNVSATLQVHAVTAINFFSQPQFRCQQDVSLTLGTGPQQPPAHYAPLAAKNPYPDWVVWKDPPGVGWHVPAKSLPFDPPQKNWLPTASLGAAVTGGTATAGNVTFTLPKFHGGPGMHCGTRESDGTAGYGLLSQVLAPLRPATGVSLWGAPWANDSFSSGTATYWGEEPEAGSGQTSIQLTIADMGIQSGLPDGFGFK